LNVDLGEEMNRDDRRLKRLTAAGLFTAGAAGFLAAMILTVYWSNNRQLPVAAETPDAVIQDVLALVLPLISEEGLPATAAQRPHENRL
jgi:hypothetical protein